MLNASEYKQTSICFNIIKQLDEQGCFSEVYLAHDLQFDSNIIVKKIEKSSFSHYDEYYAESQKIYKSRHTNVAEIHYASDDDDYIYIAMPYYVRGSLNTLITTRFLTVREIVQYSINFLSGLNNIHAKGLIHFDVKPGNILISDRNEALISDFGLTKHSDYFGLAKNDLHYNYHVPPEAFSEENFTIQYDIFQAGVTLYRMCNGNETFREQISTLTSDEVFKERISRGLFPNRKVYLPHIPSKLTKIINKMMDTDCDDGRYKTVIEVLNKLSEIDSNLNWQYQKVSNLKETWTNNNKSITIEQENGDVVVIAMNNTSRMRKYCKTFKTKKHALSIVKLFIKEND